MLTLSTILAFAPVVLAVKSPSEKTVPIDPAAVGAAARAQNLPESHLRAVVQVESDGIAGFMVDGVHEPAIRFEGHIFDRQLRGEQREQARAAGLANPKAQAVKNPRTQGGRWRLLARAKMIDEDAALESVSWGVGQVMGFHWKSLGFKNVRELVQMARSGQVGQIGLMVAFIMWAKLDDELRNGEWGPFARGYNGPAYRKNRYDEKLADAARLYGGTVTSAGGLLRMGSKGKRVREVQSLLLRSGYAVKVDGDFGPSTRDFVKEFQRANGLQVDGIVGPQTYKILSARRADSTDEPGKQAAFEIPTVRAGGLAAVVAAATPAAIQEAKNGLEAAATQIVGAGVQNVILDYVANGLTIAAAGLGVVGVVVAVRGWWQAQRTYEA